MAKRSIISLPDMFDGESVNNSGGFFSHIYVRTHISILFKSFELAKGILSEEASVLSIKCEIFPEVVVHCVKG